MEKQVLIIYAGTKGFLDDLPVEQCRAFEEELYRFVENAHPGSAAHDSREEGSRRRFESQMTAAIKEFKTRFVQEHKQLPPPSKCRA